MKIILCGYSRHGKGEVGSILQHHFGLRSYSSSWVAKEQVYDNSPLLQQEWPTADHAWNNRHYNRDEWYRQIQRINTPDKTALAQMVFGMIGCRVYDGMRDREELRACREKWPEMLIVWVVNPHKKSEDSSSNTVSALDCDFTLVNDKQLPDLQCKVKRVFSWIKGVGV